MKIIQHPIRRHEALTEAGRYAHVSLPFLAGIDLTPERAETTPTLPTIRERTTKRLRGAALASSDARKLDELAARICNYRPAMMPAVTVAMEGGAG